MKIRLSAFFLTLFQGKTVLSKKLEKDILPLLPDYEISNLNDHLVLLVVDQQTHCFHKSFVSTHIQLIFVEFYIDFLVLLRPYDPGAINLKKLI